jgi:hypothetical protein
MQLFKTTYTANVLIATATLATTTAAEVNRGLDANSTCRKDPAGVLRCSFVDERPGFEHFDVFKVNVHINSTGSSSSAWLCVNYWNAAGGECGAVQVANGTGIKTMSMDVGWVLEPWIKAANQYDFAYLSVIMSGTVMGWWAGEEP